MSRRKSAKRTGWTAYYVTDSSGCGFKTPHWVHADYLKDEDAVEDIRYRFEQWTLTADSWQIKVELNATPPQDVVDAEIRRIEESMKGLADAAKRLRGKR